MALGKEASVTPRSVMFDVLKRVGHMSHAELAGIVLSSRPLADGRSAVAHASDRSWLSRFVVHAPADVAQQRLFADYGASAARLALRLRSRRSRAMGAGDIFDMVMSDEARAMDDALAAFGSDPRAYRNLLDRLASSEGYSAAGRSELALVLFVAAGCSADAATAVDYELSYERKVFGSASPTPPSSVLCQHDGAAPGGDFVPHLGLVRLCGGYVSGQPRWIDPEGPGCVVGSLATGASDVCDVERDVSSRHLRLWFEDGTWWCADMGSANGTWVRPADGCELRLEPGCRRALAPGDELRLGAATRFVLLEGLPG